MSNDYRTLSTADLMERWEALRQKVLNKTGVLRDMDELNALRREIDRRRGETNPTVDVNFEDYITD